MVQMRYLSHHCTSMGLHICKEETQFCDATQCSCKQDMKKSEMEPSKKRLQRAFGAHVKLNDTNKRHPIDTPSKVHSKSDLL